MCILSVDDPRIPSHKRGAAHRHRLYCSAAASQPLVIHPRGNAAQRFRIRILDSRAESSRRRRTAHMQVYVYIRTKHAEYMQTNFGLTNEHTYTNICKHSYDSSSRTTAHYLTEQPSPIVPWLHLHSPPPPLPTAQQIRIRIASTAMSLTFASPHSS